MLPDFFIADIIVSSGASVFVIARRKRSPSVTLAWVMAFWLVPFAGVALYALVGYRHAKLRRRRGYVNPTRDARYPKDSLSDGECVTERLVTSLAGFPAQAGNDVRFLESSSETYAALADAILNAKKYVYLEYYIFQPDQTGRFFLSLLANKAKEGVDCRLLVDHVGSFKLNRRVLASARDAGVKIAFFSPVTLRRPWAIHLRNHRKLAITDGAYAFHGSQNVGNEYLSWKSKRVNWHDISFRVQGPSVEQVQSIFVEDWFLATGEKVSIEDASVKAQGGGSVRMQMLPTGPDESAFALEVLLVHLIANARQRISVVSPYLVPTLALTIALEGAIKRGVRVEILIPRSSDHWIADWVSKSWQRDLLRAGACLFAQVSSFPHAKLILIDDNTSLIGSANMDERSFRHNFESSALIYDRALTQHLYAYFDKIRGATEPLPRTTFDDQRWHLDLRDGFFRLLSPLM